MLRSGLQHGDLLIVDRSVEPSDSKIVVAAVDGELVVRLVKQNRRQLRLLSENPNCQTICINKDTEFQIWGVVTHVIRTLHSTR